MERKPWWHLSEGWLPLPLLFLIVLAVTRSIQEGAWERTLKAALGILPWAAVGGLIVGFLLAWLRWMPRWLAHLLGVFGGLAWVVQLSGTLREVQIQAFREPVAFIHPALQGWKDLAADLLLRTVFLLRTYRRGDMGEDIVLFIIVLALVSWFMGYVAAWLTYRSRLPWLAIGIPGVVLLLNLVYGPNVPARYFNYFAFLALVYLVQYLWRQRENAWQREKVRYPQHLARGVLWAGVLLSVILVAGTAFLPTSASSEEAASFWDRYLQPWRDLRGGWERLFGAVGVAEDTRVGAYAPAFELSGAREALAGTAFEIESDSIDYLRAITFDHYDGRGWANTAARGYIWQLPSDDYLGLADLGRVRVNYAITPRIQGGNLFFAFSEPISASIPLIAELGTPRGEAGFADVVALYARSGLAEGRTYQVTSLLSAVDKTSLRAIGLEYPNWAVERYTQLPETLPERVRTLADRIVAAKLLEIHQVGDQLLETETLSLPVGPAGEELSATLRVRPLPSGADEAPSDTDEEAIILWTDDQGQVAAVSPSGALVQEGLVTPYDATEAIQDYLRTTYPYDEGIEAPPEDVDAVAHFLFEGQAGYCDYFGSAMAVLVRTQGIPSRVVRGYASGEYDEESEIYVVPLSSAHTWTEVYFPEYGWQRFEPTAADYTTLPIRPEEAAGSGENRRPPQSDPEEDRLEDMLMEDDMPRSEFMGEGLQEDSRSFPWAAVLIPGGLMAIVLAAAGWIILWTGRGLRRLSPAAAAYERMCRWAALTGLPPRQQSTPYEFAGKMTNAFPQQSTGIQQIARSYVRERFGGRSVSEAMRDQIREAWSDLRWPLWGRLLSLRRRRRDRKQQEVGE